MSYQDRVAFACHFLDDKKVRTTSELEGQLTVSICFSASSLLDATQPASCHQWLH